MMRLGTRALAFACATSCALADGPCTAQWIPTFGGAAGVTSGLVPFEYVIAAARYDDGSGSKLFMSGHFDEVSGKKCRRIACYDGTTWSEVGGGFGPVTPYEAIGYQMLVWDDGSGPSLFVGGDFITAGNVVVNCIAKWNGIVWTPLGTGLDNYATDLLVFDDGSGEALYVSGEFTTAGGVPASKIAKWNGRDWQAVGIGMNSTVNGLTAFDDGSGAGPQLCATGQFTMADGVDAKRVARWNGTNWSPIGSGLGLNPVTWEDRGIRLAATTDAFGQGPRLYVCGSFKQSGGSPLIGIAEWDGLTWKDVGGFPSTPLSAVAWNDSTPDARGGRLLVGGSFGGVIQGQSMTGLAQWDGSTWSNVGGSVDYPVKMIRCMDGGDGAPPEILVGGQFSKAGELGALGIASWDGEAWHGFGPGLTAGAFGKVMALAQFDDGIGGGVQLYAGGDFPTAGGELANGIARWDGIKWHTLAGGVTGPMLYGDPVRALAVFDDGSGPALFVGGEFRKAGSQHVGHIARWNGVEWSALGSGVSGTINALAVYDDGLGSGPALFAGGSFTIAGGVSASRVARWDGTQWSPLGDGLNGVVRALVVHDDGSGSALYVGGSFTQAGGISANRIARWDGLTWTAMGSGADDTVEAFAVGALQPDEPPALYAGGRFSSVNGVPAELVARWDGKSWVALGAGLGGDFSNTARTLAVCGDASTGGATLFAGGMFTGAGVGGSFARWNGVAWAAASPGFSIGVFSLFSIESADGPSLLVGGDFDKAPSTDSLLARLVLCPTECTADLSGDRLVDGADIAVLLGQWGAPSPGGQSADLNQDGAVDGVDIALVLWSWGECP